MARFFHPLIHILASLSHSDLAKQIQFLKAENEILRSKLSKRIFLSHADRSRLLRLGKAVGPAIKHLISIVSYRTFSRWMAAKRKNTAPAKCGRPRTPDFITAIIISMADATGWGYTRILGELRKLGFCHISRTTIINILKLHGYDPGPCRGEGSWDSFIRIHTHSLCACDFLSKKVFSLRGFLDCYILFFINVSSRLVFISGISCHPTASWMAQQARNFFIHLADFGKSASYLIHDMDSKFTPQFKAILKSGGVTPLKIPPLSPNLNAFAERWVQSIKYECLNHFIVLGEDHLRHIVREYVDYYNSERPHQSLGNLPLSSSPNSTGPPTTGNICCRERLGGLLKHYYRKAS